MAKRALLPEPPLWHLFQSHSLVHAPVATGHHKLHIVRVHPQVPPQQLVADAADSCPGDGRIPPLAQQHLLPLIGCPDPEADGELRHRRDLILPEQCGGLHSVQVHRRAPGKQLVNPAGFRHARPRCCDGEHLVTVEDRGHGHVLELHRLGRRLALIPAAGILRALDITVDHAQLTLLLQRRQRVHRSNRGRRGPEHKDFLHLIHRERPREIPH
mmetsp:Transcript_66716/g.177883  ORF Transcript_66716/g.177883 Transcript_66716/m.177883 type:complete len:214 (-) Transcript_66716:188-829(-)